MKHRLLLASLLGLAITTFSMQGHADLSELQEFYRNDPWGWVEQKFVLEIDEQVKSWLSTLKLWAGTGASAATFGSAGYFGPSYFISEAEYQAMVKTLLGALFAAAGGRIGYKYLKPYLEQCACENALVAYVSGAHSDWEGNLLLLPEVMKRALDKLRRTYIEKKDKKALYLKTRKLMRVIQKQIYEHFEDRYKSRLQRLYDEGDSQGVFDKINITSWNYNIDIGRVLSGIGNAVYWLVRGYNLYSETQAKKEDRAERKREDEAKKKEDERCKAKAQKQQVPLIINPAQPAPPPTYGGDTGQPAPPPSYGEVVTPQRLYPHVAAHPASNRRQESPYQAFLDA